ncbi:MAG: DsbA family protein [Patescibacteria group bacterium]|nr:DsbA family protein [Patescibacteria group bacterium]
MEKAKDILLAVLFVALVGVLVYHFGFIGVQAIKPQAAVAMALNYINAEMVSGGVKAELNGKIEEQSGVYKFSMKLGGQEYSSYISKDGKILFPQGVVVPATTSSSVSGGNVDAQNKEQACAALNKADKPVLEAFVVSYCPYGLQMQRVLAEIVKEAPQAKDAIKIEYIGAVENGKITSMHGDEEAQENLRQICLREEQNDKFFPYLACFLQKGESQNCLTQANVDQQKLDACMKDSSRGLAFAQKDFVQGEKYQVSGSPTLILNGQGASESAFGGRSAAAVSDLICCGMASTSSAAFCSGSLSAEEASTGFSEQYSGGSGSGNSSCQ